MKKNIFISLLFFSSLNLFCITNFDFKEFINSITIETACIGQYSATQAGETSQDDPIDYYSPKDIADYLKDLSGYRTKTETFYGVCFDYAEYFYKRLIQLNMLQNGIPNTTGKFYIVGDIDEGIILYSTENVNSKKIIMNGVEIYEEKIEKVIPHNNAKQHAWIWIQRSDGEWFWVDPTWTDNLGYVVWGIVKDGKEIQLQPDLRYCKKWSDELLSLIDYNSTNLNNNPPYTVIPTNVEENPSIQVQPSHPESSSYGYDYYLGLGYYFDLKNNNHHNASLGVIIYDEFFSLTRISFDLYFNDIYGFLCNLAYGLNVFDFFGIYALISFGCLFDTRNLIITDIVDFMFTFTPNLKIGGGIYIPISDIFMINCDYSYDILLKWGLGVSVYFNF